MRTRPVRSSSVALLLVALCAVLVLGASRDAHAKMSSKEWKAAEKQFRELFGSRGKAPERVAITKKIAGDGTARAWRLLAEGLHLEVQLWSQVRADLAEASKEHGQILGRSARGYSPNDGQRVQALQGRIEELEAEGRAEEEALAAILDLVTQGSKDLRKHILKRAKPDSDWAYRAAALRVAARTMGERPSLSHVKKAFAKEEDARVRWAGVEALAKAPERWEGFLLDRLADPDGAVVLAAARVAQQRGFTKALPRIADAMAGASAGIARGLRRAAEALAQAVPGPEAEAWAARWAEHEKGRTHARICGVPLESDRVVFLLDVSVGTGKEPKEADAHWKADPSDGSPPEPRLAGSGLDIAKHELKKAIMKLPEGSTFNVIAFNQAAVPWQRKMMTAKKKNKEAAYKWLRGLEPRGVSYTDGALRMAFRMAGLLEFGPVPAPQAADTLVLLSVGKTTDNALPDAGLMDPQVVLEHVRAWNRRQLVVVHCVALLGSEYMKTLAAENGGVYVE